MPEKFIPNGTVTLGDVDGFENPEIEGFDSSSEPNEPYGETEDVKTFSSLLEYAKDELNNSSFEMEAKIQSFRGPTFVYEGKDSIIAVSDYENGLGIDLYCFDGEPDTRPVIEHLYSEISGKTPDVKNNMHKTLYGEEAHDEIHKLLESEK